MKLFFQWTLAAITLAAAMTWNGTAAAQFYGYGGGGTEMNSVLTIKADGSSVFTTETVESRTMAEQQVRMMEQYKKMREATEAGEEPTKPDLTSTNETKPFTDEELAKKLNESMNERYGENMEDSGQKYTVAMKTNTVVFTSTRSFASLEEMLKDNYEIWIASGVSFENVRFETDTNGLLKLSLTSTPGRNSKIDWRSRWKLSGAKTEMKIIFPGKVVSSGFSATEGNATWFAVDSKKDESLDALAKLVDGTTVITAEAGGLKLDAPVESKKLLRSRRQRAAGGDELPITDAGPGFVAEAQGITTTITHVFPGGEDYFKQNGNSSPTGAVVNAKLFAPKGRTLQTVSDVRVLTAVDDKGRSVVAEPEAGEEIESYRSYGGSPDANSMPIQLHLQLPAPDAQAIDTIAAEVVATTVGTWKEMTLTNLQENATNELDLATVVPGAKLVIVKNSSKNGQINIQARLKGPGTVRRLELRAKIPGNDRFNSNSSERNSSTKGGETTRTLTIQGYGYGEEGGLSPATVVLIVRYPADLRRERVKFNLKGLDLL